MGEEEGSSEAPAALLSKYSFSDISAMPCRFSAPEEPSRACRLDFFGKAGRIGSSLPEVVVTATLLLLVLLMSMSISSEEVDADECSKWSLGVIALLDRGMDRDRGFCCRGVDGFCCRGVVGVRNRGVVLGLNRGVDSLKGGPDGSSLRGPVLVLGDGGTADAGAVTASKGPE